MEFEFLEIFSCPSLLTWKILLLDFKLLGTSISSPLDF